MNDINTRSAELAVRPRVSHVEARRVSKDAEAAETATAASPSGKPPPVAPVAPREVDAAETRVSVEQAVAQLNDYVQSLQRDIRFSIDPASRLPVVRVVERDSQEVIRQIPSETALRLARSLKEMEGLEGLDGVQDVDARSTSLADIALFRAQA